MAVTVAAVMRLVNNYFEEGRIDGRIAIIGNAITPDPDYPWCFIRGSRYHDGVWQVCGGRLQDMDGKLQDEEFDGRVWLLKPPPDFLALCEEISAYDDRNPAGALMQEKFGNYSYMRGYQDSSKPWWTAYAQRLARYRSKMFTEVG